jgi:hypothetical protein
MSDSVAGLSVIVIVVHTVIPYRSFPVALAKHLYPLPHIHIPYIVIENTLRIVPNKQHQQDEDNKYL